jgi:hypothetical protein
VSIFFHLHHKLLVNLRRANADIFVHEFHRFRMLGPVLLGSFGVTTTLLATTKNPPPGQPIPWHQLGSQATAQYSGDGLGVIATPRGAQLRCVLQKLEGEVTAEGLSLHSTVPDARDQFHVSASRVGRDGGQNLALAKHGTVQVIDAHAHYLRPGLSEEYSVTADGIRQDFLVTQSPAGPGPLRLHLTLRGARAEVSPDGAQLALNESGRKLNYNRLRVIDATGRQLAAWVEIAGKSKIQNLKSKMDLAVVVEDAGAVYPLRIDPTFSDANWISMGGLPGANGEVFAAAVDGSGNLYIGGLFTRVGNVPATNIAKWNGTNWSALGFGVNRFGPVRALAVSGSDLYAGGFFTTGGGSPATNIAKWNGTNWSALGSGMNNTVFALVVLGSDLYAGGVFSTAGGNPVNYIAKWNGTSWSALGSGMGGETSPSVNALAVSGSDLYAGGWFTAAGGIPANRIAKWNGTSWSALGSGTGGTDFPYVYALAVSGTNLYAGGRFTVAGGSPANYIAKWDGSSWSAPGSGMNYYVHSLAVSGSELYAGGFFSTAGGSPANYIAKWNGSSWSALGSGMGFGGGNPEHTLTAWALAVSGSDLYAGGYFLTAGGKSSAYVANARIASAAESITASGSSVTIQFSGVVGYDYHVQRTDSLTPPMTWTTLTTTPLSPADDGSLTFTDTTAPPGTAYYRLVQQ